MMATYFNGGSEIQADNLQTLYLMNPSYGAYSDGQAPSSMLLLNPATASSASAPNALTPASLQHLPSHQQLVGIPLAPPGSTSPGDGDDPTLHEIPSSAAGLHGLVPRLHYNLWGAVTADPPSSGTGHQTQIPTAIAVSGGGGHLGAPMGFRRPQAVTLATSNALDHHHHQQHAQQGLSLSLNNSSPHKNVAGPSAVLSPGDGSPTSASRVTNGVAGGGGAGLILGSKYLKAAQQLLDEVVNVGKALSMADSGAKEKAKAAVVGGAGEGSTGGTGKKGGAADLSTAQRQELQMKKAKLLNMLDEVEQRYRQYHSQMQLVASSFEQAAGAGSARSYTSLALQTISKQFRCLKDAITSQIKATAKSLGEDDDGGGGGGKAEGSRSRLRFVDYQLRQQRALQQLGMMQHNAWRPQRGLPERAVSVLRAWLFEHFLHPYPKDSDKHMLAKQTGLSRSQVSNWFINARVRLWKPMVEEMYLEEMKGHEQNGSDDQANNNNKDSTTSSKSAASLDKSPHHMNVQNSLGPPSSTNVNDISNSTVDLSPALQGFSLIRPSDMESMIQTQRSPKRQRSSSDIHNYSPSSILSMDMEMKPSGDPSRDLFTPVPNHGGFGAYPINGDIGSRFNPDHQQLGQRYHQNIQAGNAVSLTLGLPHCENQHQHNFIPAGQAVQLGRRLDIGIGEAELCGITTSQPPHSGTAGYPGIDIQNRKRFAAQLLPDFVA